MKRILVTSIPSWSQTSGANTYSTLLEGIPDVEIANLYTKADSPDSLVCSRYFQILEGAVVKSVFNRNVITGKEVCVRHKNQAVSPIELAEKKRYSFFSKNRLPIFLWGRELLWKLGRWNSKELDDFLDDFKPDVLMFSIESYLYFNRINNYIIKHCKPSLVIGFLWDDNFTYKQSNNISYYISRFFVRKSAVNLVKSCNKILAISPKMKRECDEFFGVNSILVTKPIRSTNVSEYKNDSIRPIRLIYTGKMIIGRNRSLVALAAAIQKINNDGQKMYLDIYTSTKLDKVDEVNLNIDGCCCVHGSIPQSQVFIEQEQSDILVFVESFTNRVARLSFSTKITDYLSSRRCILAIGPDDISSIEYLKENNAAIICNSQEEIYSQLRKIIDSPNMIKYYANNAYKCGINNHSASVISNTMRSVLEV